MAITKLEDFQNFGEWKTTINSVIDSVNGYGVTIDEDMT